MLSLSLSMMMNYGGDHRIGKLERDRKREIKDQRERERERARAGWGRGEGCATTTCWLRSEELGRGGWIQRRFAWRAYRYSESCGMARKWNNQWHEGTQNTRCCPGSLPHPSLLPVSPSLSLCLSRRCLPSPWERCRVRRCSLRKPSSHFSLSLSLFLFCFSLQFVEVVVMNNQWLDTSRSRKVSYWK